MADILNFLTFIMTLSIPVIAIVAELSHKTPSTFLHSMIRSIICLGSLFFLSVVLNQRYIPCWSHFMAVGFIFVVSAFQLIIELNQDEIEMISSSNEEPY